MPKEGFGWITRQIKVMEPPAYGKQCAWYSREERDEYFDSMWNAGFAMAAISVTLGIVVMSLVLCTCCVAFQLPAFDGLFWTCMICFVAQALTFLSWGSELCDTMECTWSSGTGMNLTAAMMWVWAANMIKSFPEALPPRKRRSGRDREHGYDDDEDGAGDVYLSNRNLSVNDDQYYQDEHYDDQGDWDNNDQGYYDEDGNWVDKYDEDDGSGYYGNDNGYYDNEEGSAGGGGYAYNDYDQEDSSNWADEGDGNEDDTKKK